MTPPSSSRGRSTRGAEESPLVKWVLISIALGFCFLVLLLPLANVFAQALAKGCLYVVKALAEPDSLAAIRLTLLVAAISVPLNVLFGLAAAWAIAKFEFPGKTILITLIDLPFSVSPVVAGLMFVVLFGLQGFFGQWLDAHNLKIIFAVPGIVLATVFVTFPFVARELIPVMQATGSEQEQAALTLGRQRLANLLARHAAVGQMGPALRRHPVQRAGDGGVRRRLGRLRPYRRPDRDHAVAGGDALQGATAASAAAAFAVASLLAHAGACLRWA